MSVADALQLMLAFGTFIVALIALIVELIKSQQKKALCQILLMGHFRRRPVLAPGAAFFQLPFPFDAIGSGR